MRVLTIAAILTTLAGCGESDTADIDAGQVDAAAPLDAATPSDAASADAASADAAAPSDAGALDTNVVLTYGGSTGTFDRAFYGYERSETEILGVYLELHRGAAAECPSESSPTPDQTLILAGFTGVAPASRTEADGVRASLFDFEGRFREDIAPATASAARLTFDALGSERDIARGSVELTFAEGTASGRFAAIHCPSFDSISP